MIRLAKWNPGNALIATVITVPALLGLVSLGVDYGRIQLIKTELQHAADAAARYAATGISSGPSVARSRAKSAAGENTVGGAAMSLSDSDIELGTWDPAARTFTKLTGAAESNANAVRIIAARTAARGNAVPLTFARALGQSTCDVTAVAVSYVVTATASGGAGVTALSKFEMENNASIDSYDSSAGAYSPAAAGSNAVVQTNGKVKMKNNAKVWGDAHPGIGESLDLDNNATVTGNTANLTETLSFDPVDTTAAAASNNNAALSSSYFNSGSRDFKMENNDSYTMPAGTYYFDEFKLKNNATLTLAGIVIIYTTGKVTLENNATVNTFGNRPTNLQFKMAGGKDFKMKNNSKLTADIYNPGGEIELENNTELSGVAVADEIKLKNNAKIHQDRSISGSGGGGGSSISIALVK